MLKEIIFQILASRLLIASIVGGLCVLAIPRIVSFSFLWVSFFYGFCITAFIYLKNNNEDMKEDKINTAGLHSSILNKYGYLVFFLPMPVFYLYFDWISIVAYLSIAIVGRTYSKKIPYTTLRIKDIPIIKNVFCAFLASLLIQVIPIFVLNINFNFILFGLTSLIYINNEILWDIRDVEGDTSNSTIPLLFGVNSAKLIIVIITIITFYIYLITMPHILYIVSIPLILTMLVGIISKPNKKPLLYHLPILAWLISIGYLLAL